MSKFTLEVRQQGQVSYREYYARTAEQAINLLRRDYRLSAKAAQVVVVDQQVAA